MRQQRPVRTAGLPGRNGRASGVGSDSTGRGWACRPALSLVRQAGRRYLPCPAIRLAGARVASRSDRESVCGDLSCPSHDPAGRDSGSPGAACRTSQRTARGTQTRRKTRTRTTKSPNRAVNANLERAPRDQDRDAPTPDDNPPTQTVSAEECRRESGEQQTSGRRLRAVTEWNCSWRRADNEAAQHRFPHYTRTWCILAWWGRHRAHPGAADTALIRARQTLRAHPGVKQTCRNGAETGPTETRIRSATRWFEIQSHETGVLIYT